jgi:hypothetical protein
MLSLGFPAKALASSSATCWNSILSTTTITTTKIIAYPKNTPYKVQIYVFPRSLGMVMRSGVRISGFTAYTSRRHTNIVLVGRKSQDLYVFLLSFLFIMYPKYSLE